VEQRHGEPEHFLDHQLRFVHVWVLGRVELLVEVVFAESEHGDKVGALADRELDEPLALLEDEFQRARFSVKGFARAADNDGDGAAHAFAVAAAFGKDVFAAFARDRGEAHAESVVAVEGHAEIGIECEEGVGDAREELLEA